MSLKSSTRAFDRESDRIAQHEETQFAEKGHYSACGGCGGECNPSNVHADGRKFCDDCWELSDDEYGSLSPKENRAIELHEKWKRQLKAGPVKRHSTRENYMRYAEKQAKLMPVVSGNADQTYQVFMLWHGQDFHKTLAEVLDRRTFVMENRDALEALVRQDLHSNKRNNRCPKRLRERCNVGELMGRFSDWNPNSNTDMKALEYLQTLRGVLKQINGGIAHMCISCAKLQDDCTCKVSANYFRA